MQSGNLKAGDRHAFCDQSGNENCRSGPGLQNDPEFFFAFLSNGLNFRAFPEFFSQFRRGQGGGKEQCICNMGVQICVFFQQTFFDDDGLVTKIIQFRKDMAGEKNRFSLF